MPTVVDLSEQELAELKAFTKEADASAAVRSAMSKFLRVARRQPLKALSGQITMDDNWQSLETADVSG